MTRSTIAFSEDSLASTGQGSGTAFDQQFATPGENLLWRKTVLGQIEGLSSLPRNWDSYGASPANRDSLERAQEFIIWLSSFEGVEMPDVGLTANGNVAFMWEWDNATRNLDIEIQPDGTIGFSYLDGNDESREEDGQTDDGERILSFLTDW